MKIKKYTKNDKKTHQCRCIIKNMNVVSKRRSNLRTIKDMNRINNRRNHCLFREPICSDSSLKFKFLRAGDFFALSA